MTTDETRPSDQDIRPPEPPAATRLNKLALIVAAAIMSATLLTVAFVIGGGSDEPSPTHAQEDARQPSRRHAQTSFLDRPPAEEGGVIDPFTGLGAADLEASTLDPDATFITADGPSVSDRSGLTPPPYGASEPYRTRAPRRGQTAGAPDEQALHRALRSSLRPRGSGAGVAAVGSVSPAGQGGGGFSERSVLAGDAALAYDHGYLEALKEIGAATGTAGTWPSPGAAALGSAALGSSSERAQTFLQQAAGARQGSNYIATAIQQPMSPFEVREGTLIEAFLLTGIHSDLPGEVVAQVSRSVYDSHTQQTLLIPKGTRLIGSYDNQIALDQSRLLVAWTRMVFPDGRSVNLPGLNAKDLAGANGLTGQVNRHYWRAFGNAMMLAVVGGSLSYAAQTTRRDGAYGYPTPGEVMAGSVATELSRVATEILRGSVTRRPTIRIREGTPFNVFMNGDLALAPYAPQDGFMEPVSTPPDFQIAPNQ